MNAIKYTPMQAAGKIRQYCAYQERCHYEVEQKLYSYGLYKKEVDILVAQLIEENYLDEERFAILFAGGKFRMKGWGKVKIKQELKKKKVSDYSINKALKQLDDTDYVNKLIKFTERKLISLKSEKNMYVRKRKLQDFLLRKGYSPDDINMVVAKLKDQSNK